MADGNERVDLLGRTQGEAPIDSAYESPRIISDTRTNDDLEGKEALNENALSDSK